MTHATQKLIEEFEALPDRDRSELVAELARRVTLAPHDLPQEEDLVAPPIASSPILIVASGLNEVAAPGRGLVGGPRHGGESAACARHQHPG